MQAVTQEAVTYVGGLRRYRALVNNDGGALTIEEEDVPRDRQPAFLAAERERRGIGENDMHFVTIYEARP